MTQFQPPPAPATGPAASVAVAGPAPWSALAITAFVCAVLGFLGFTAILGVILGIAGIVVTRGGRLRGIGLAVAAIPVSLVTGAVSVMLLFAFMFMSNLMHLPDKLKAVLAGDPTPAVLAAFREMTSKEFDEAVSDEKLRAWANQVREDNGSLVDLTFERLSRAGQQDGKAGLAIPAKFVNGEATIQIIFSSESRTKPRLHDIAIGGVSPRDSD